MTPAIYRIVAATPRQNAHQISLAMADSPLNFLPMSFSGTNPLEPTDAFARRHIGPSLEEQRQMLAALGFSTLGELTEAAVPSSIRLRQPLQLPPPLTESSALETLKALAGRNQVFRSYLGMGYSDCIIPAVIQRSILENPGWYTQYTPYQAEIAQGRLEGLLNFQTMVCDLTGLEIANASLLDEATAAAEAMTMAFGLKRAEDATWSSSPPPAIPRTSTWSERGRGRLAWTCAWFRSINSPASRRNCSTSWLVCSCSTRGHHRGHSRLCAPGRVRSRAGRAAGRGR